MPNDNEQDYSCLYELLRTKPRVKKSAVKEVVVQLPRIERAYFVPAKDKILGIDKSRDCKIEKDFTKDNGYIVSIEIALLFRQLLNVRPELQYVCKHSANVFAKKTCYIFLDTKRNVKIAYTRQEIKEQITNR